MKKIASKITQITYDCIRVADGADPGLQNKCTKKSTEVAMEDNNPSKDIKDLIFITFLDLGFVINM